MAFPRGRNRRRPRVPGITPAQAVQDFLRDDLDAETIRSYGQTLRRLCLTADLPHRPHRP
jgi:hypothetical protein